MCIVLFFLQKNILNKKQTYSNIWYLIKFENSQKKMLSRIWRRQLTDLTKSQIKARLERSSVTLIDVRRFDEVDAGVIETPRGKWIHIPLNELEEALELDNDDFAAQFECDQKPDKNDELIFYCMKGVRSASAALYFEQNVSSKIDFEKLFD